MGKKVFLGYIKNRQETLYRVIDSENFRYYDYSLKDLRANLKDVINLHIKLGEVITEDGLVYGVKSIHTNECMNTYTIIGHSLGCYVICDFNKTEIMALHEYEILLNKEKFIRHQVTNAMLVPRVGDEKQYALDVIPYNAGIIDNVSRYVCSGKEYRVRALEYMKLLYETRLSTMQSGEYKLEKFNRYNINILNSNISEIDSILNDKDKLTKIDLQKLLKKETVDKPMIDTFYINRDIYGEE